nr:S-layer homology domain-containing protein [Paenibacillus sp. 598K]
MGDYSAPFWHAGSQLQATNVTQTSVSLGWPQASDQVGVTGYRIYLGDATEPLATLAADQMTYDVSGLMAGTAYVFTVKAIDEAGNESVGLTVRATTTAPSSSGPWVGTPGGGATSGDTKTSLAAGAAGGVSMGDLAKVSVPAGATDAPMELTIAQLTDPSGLIGAGDTLVSPVFEITKTTSGAFLKPVSLAFKFDPSLIGEGKEASIFWYDEEAKRWVEVGGTVDGDVVTATVDHFTKFAVFAVDETSTEEPGGTEPEVPVKLTDIAGHWAEAAIRKAAAAGIVKGYEDDTFRPGNTVTRAEFAVMLMNATGKQGAAATLDFADRASIPSWAASAVAAAVDAGVVSGYPDGTFRPNANITRMEMAAMIAASLELDTSSGSATSFADNADIPAWAKGSIKAVSDAGIVQGRPGNLFAPRATATRADSITMIMNMLETR